ncbi:hypothetical protein CoNPh17_CDS0093 [Staphylococcus phage S-CoN_Ph17]|nr:hypothetical protein CoNPh17_CDS0093 [Staphylococcus phage S-CoN_Ph17]
MLYASYSWFCFHYFILSYFPQIKSLISVKRLKEFLKYFGYLLH